MHFANSSTTGGGIDPGCAECQVWGGFGACDDNTGTGVLVWHSGNITPFDTWQLYTATFTATQNYTWIMFRVNSLNCSTGPYILLDNISPITGANVLATIDSTNVLCPGSANGAATAHAIGIHPPFTYSWAVPPSTDSTISGLSAGTYTVTVDSMPTPCISHSVSVAITQLTQLFLHFTITVQPTCTSTGSAYMSYAGGTSPFTFLWNNGPTTQSNPNLFAGTYGITATDANQCSASSSITLNVAGGITDSVSVVNALCGSNANSATVYPITATIDLCLPVEQWG